MLVIASIIIVPIIVIVVLLIVALGCWVAKSRKDITKGKPPKNSKSPYPQPHAQVISNQTMPVQQMNTVQQPMQQTTIIQQPIDTPIQQQVQYVQPMVQPQMQFQPPQQQYFQDISQQLNLPDGNQ